MKCFSSLLLSERGLDVIRRLYGALSNFTGYSLMEEGSTDFNGLYFMLFSSIRDLLSPRLDNSWVEKPLYCEQWCASENL